MHEKKQALLCQSPGTSTPVLVHAASLHPLSPPLKETHKEEKQFKSWFDSF